jgi:hypothetical protein
MLILRLFGYQKEGVNLVSLTEEAKKIKEDIVA